MTRLTNEKQTVEADFRYAAMQLRENAEQVAFYRGGERERQRLSGLFERIRRNTLSIIGRMVKVGLTQGAYGVLTAPVTSQSAGLLALPRYFAGELTLGGLARISTAFGAFCGTLGVFSQMYVTFAAWWAIANRLRALGGRLAAHRDQPGGITLAATGALSLQTSEIQLHTPDGAALNGVPALTLTPGERVMLCGPSGAGKSTLLRALAGLWPHGQGRVLLPTAARTMFLPQKSYIPDGSQRGAQAYPAGPDDFAEADLVAALQRCGLGRLAGRLNDVARWQRELSGGEQQRLAMARALLHRPDFIFMDEATSALDEAGEVQLYTALLEQLPRSAVLSVSHHEALIRFHDRRIVLPAPAATA